MYNQSKARHDIRQQCTIISYAEESFELVKSCGEPCVQYKYCFPRSNILNNLVGFLLGNIILRYVAFFNVAFV